MHWEASAYAPSNHTCTVVGPTGDDLTADTGTLTIDQQIGAVGPIGCYLAMWLYRPRAGTVTTNAAPGSTITAQQSDSML